MNATDLNDLLSKGKIDEYMAELKPIGFCCVYKALINAEDIYHIRILKHIGLKHPNTCAIIAAVSTVEVMEYALPNDCEMSMDASIRAVYYEKKHIVKCLLKYGCPANRFALWWLNIDQSVFEYLTHKTTLNYDNLFDYGLYSGKCLLSLHTKLKDYAIKSTTTI